MASLVVGARGGHVVLAHVREGFVTARTLLSAGAGDGR